MKPTLKVAEYYPDDDILFLAFSQKRGIEGDVEYQDDVILFRDEKTSNIIGVEILDFNDFGDDFIKISKTECINLAKVFYMVKCVASFSTMDIKDFRVLQKILSSSGITLEIPDEFSLKRDPIHLPISRSLAKTAELSTVGCH